MRHGSRAIRLSFKMSSSAHKRSAIAHDATQLRERQHTKTIEIENVVGDRRNFIVAHIEDTQAHWWEDTKFNKKTGQGLRSTYLGR